jgi:hypothetical protein
VEAQCCQLECSAPDQGPRTAAFQVESSNVTFANQHNVTFANPHNVTFANPHLLHLTAAMMKGTLQYLVSAE